MMSNMAPTRRRRRGNRQLRAGNLDAIMSPKVVPIDRPRVLLAGKLTALASPGGGETQMLATARFLPAVGVNASFWRPWEHKLADFDVLHLFGSLREFVPLARTAHATGLRVALSTIAWFDLRSRWRDPGGISHRLTACGKYLVRRAAPRLPSWRRRLYHLADVLLPNSRAEADQLVAHFGVPENKIRIVPNGADERFAHADPAPFAALVGERRFVLYAGRIEPRKNQLGFLRAMRGAQAPIVILGDVVPGHEDYERQCRSEAGAHVRFVGRIEHDDPLLASAYAACGCLALASWFETPGLVALEAGMSGVPLVLPREGCAKEYFGELAQYVSPDDPAGIRLAVLAALSEDRSSALADHVRQRYTWRAAAEATREAYRRCLE
jgi:glycosyltransferase involved in cell wall biosynthesis